MVSVLIHAGFHKTATTSLQHTARENAELLEPYLRVILRPDMIAVTEAARSYSANPTYLKLADFQGAAADLFAGLDKDDKRPIALLSEDLSGIMPGRRSIADYSATVDLMPSLIATCKEAFGSPDCSIYYTTRTASEWYASAHWQLMRRSRKGLTIQGFSEAFPDAADFDSICKRVANAVEDVPVVVQPLEQLRGYAKGPIEPVLAALSVPNEVIQSVQVPPRANVSMPELRHVFRELNVSPLSDRDVDELKTNALHMRRAQLDAET